jgi:hypothetical protein
MEASANWSTRTSQYSVVPSSYQGNQAATSFFHTFLTPSVSRNADDRIHLAKFQDQPAEYNQSGAKQIFRGASTSQWSSEPLKGERQHSTPATAEVPGIHAAIVFPSCHPLFAKPLNYSL